VLTTGYPLGGIDPRLLAQPQLRLVQKPFQRRELLAAMEAACTAKGRGGH